MVFLLLPLHKSSDYFFQHWQLLTYKSSKPCWLRASQGSIYCRATGPHCIILYKWWCYCFRSQSLSYPSLHQLPDPGKPIIFCLLCESKNRQTQIQTHFQYAVCRRIRMWSLYRVQASPQCWPCPPSSLEWMHPCPECPTSRRWTFISGSASSLSSCLCWSMPLSTTCPPSRTAGSARWENGHDLRFVSTVFYLVLWEKLQNGILY